MLPSASSTALAAVARAVAEAPTLGDAVSRLAVALHEAIPFDHLHLLRLDRTESVTLYVATAAGKVELRTHRISESDSATMPVDQDAASRLLCPIRHGTKVHGALWLTATALNVFDSKIGRAHV